MKPNACFFSYCEYLVQLNLLQNFFIVWLHKIIIHLKFLVIAIFFPWKSFPFSRSTPPSPCIYTHTPSARSRKEVMLRMVKNYALVQKVHLISEILQVFRVFTFGSDCFQHLCNQKARSHCVSPSGYKHRLPMCRAMSCNESGSMECSFSKCTSPFSSTWVFLLLFRTNKKKTLTNSQLKHKWFGKPQSFKIHS
jgi:hypothetical protein